MMLRDKLEEMLIEGCGVIMDQTEADKAHILRLYLDGACDTAIALGRMDIFNECEKMRLTVNNLKKEVRHGFKANKDMER